MRVVEEVGAGAEAEEALIGAREFWANGRPDRLSAEFIVFQLGDQALQHLVRQQDLLLSQAEVPLDAWLPGARMVQTVFLWAAKAVIKRHECAATL
jgi:hypothetical protein